MHFFSYLDQQLSQMWNGKIKPSPQRWKDQRAIKRSQILTSGKQRFLFVTSDSLSSSWEFWRSGPINRIEWVVKIISFLQIQPDSLICYWIRLTMTIKWIRLIKKSLQSIFLLFKVKNCPHTMNQLVAKYKFYIFVLPNLCQIQWHPTWCKTWNADTASPLAQRYPL